jgi:hypothetical protein
MRTTSQTLLTLAAALALQAAATAGPRVTETADALAARDCELEAAAGRETTTGAPSLRAWELIAGCGVGANTQLGLGMARATVDGTSASAYALLGKTTLAYPQAGLTGWGVAYGLGAVKDPDRSTRLEELSLSLVATRTLADGWLGHANLGVSHSRDARHNTTLWSVGIESTDDLVLAADLFGDDRTKPWASAGVGWAFGGGLSASVSYALQFEKPRVKAWTLGAKLAF